MKNNIRFEINVHAIKKMYEWMITTYRDGRHSDYIEAIYDTETNDLFLFKEDCVTKINLVGCYDEYDDNIKDTEEKPFGVRKDETNLSKSDVIRGIQAKYHPSLTEKWDRDEEIQKLAAATSYKSLYHKTKEVEVNKKLVAEIDDLKKRILQLEGRNENQFIGDK